MKNPIFISNNSSPSSHSAEFSSAPSHHEPDIKLTGQGYLIYANSTGISFLRFITFFTGMPAIRYLLQEHPEMITTGQKTDLTFDIGNTIIKATVEPVGGEYCISLHLNQAIELFKEINKGA